MITVFHTTKIQINFNIYAKIIKFAPINPDMI